MLLLFTLLGCASESHIAPDASQHEAPNFSGLPGLPSDDPRQPSSNYTRTIPGSTTFKRSANTYNFDSALQLSKDTKPVWAMYQFHGKFADYEKGLVEIHLLNQPAYLPKHLYVGLSDYSAMHWVWNTMDSAGADVILAPAAAVQHPSPAGNFYVVVLCVNEKTMIEDVTLGNQYAPPPPVNLQASQAKFTTGVKVDWDDPAVTYAGDPSFAYDSVIVERKTSGPVDPWKTLGTVAAGTSTYFDYSASLYTNAEHLTYRVRSLNDAIQGEPGGEATGWIDALPLLSIHSSPSMIHAPGSLDLNPSGTRDPDGGEVNFAWDFDNSGDWEDYGNDGDVSFQTDGVGRNQSQSIGLRVTDDEGNAVTSSVSVPVLGNVRRWKIKDPGYVFADGGLSGDGFSYLYYRSLTGYSILVECDPDCNLFEVKSWDDSFEHIACAADGSFFLYDASRIAHFNSSAVCDWAESCSPALNAVTAKVDPSGNLWLLCAVGSNFQDMHIACISKSGSPIFREALVNGSIRLARCDLTFDSDGNAVLVATIMGNANHPCVAKLALDGTLLWQEQVSTATADAEGISIAGADEYSVLIDQGAGLTGMAKLDLNGVLTSAYETQDLSNPSRMFMKGDVTTIQVDNGFASTKNFFPNAQYLWSWTLLTTKTLLTGAAHGDSYLLFDNAVGGTWQRSFGDMTESTFTVETTSLLPVSIPQDLTPFSLNEVSAPGITEVAGQTVCRFSDDGFGLPGG